MTTSKYMELNMLKILNKLMYKIDRVLIPIYKDGKLSHYIECIKEINRLTGKIKLLYTYNIVKGGIDARSSYTL